jgi:hypothetical protein
MATLNFRTLRRYRPWRLFCDGSAYLWDGMTGTGVGGGLIGGLWPKVVVRTGCQNWLPELVVEG